MRPAKLKVSNCSVVTVIIRIIMKSAAFDHRSACFGGQVIEHFRIALDAKHLRLQDIFRAVNNSFGLQLALR